MTNPILKSKPCPGCDGRGVRFTEEGEERNCPSCDGTGISGEEYL